MAALRATALGDCGGSSSDEDGCHYSGGGDTATVATTLVTITRVALAIAHFIVDMQT
jgi:hypothetical protein